MEDSPDGGKEFARYKDVEEELDIPVFFPDPHAPYQRGSNENTNGLIQEYFPKNTPLEALSETDIETIINSSNNRPRKVLGWRTPTEVFFNQSRT
jgi:IS30 family transposase